MALMASCLHVVQNVLTAGPTAALVHHVILPGMPVGNRVGDWPATANAGPTITLEAGFPQFGERIALEPDDGWLWEHSAPG